MKKILLIIAIVVLLTGCFSAENESSFVESESSEKADIYTSKESEISDLFLNYPNLGTNIKNKIYKLAQLWKKFNDGKADMEDPTESFHNSKYISELKIFLNQRDSTEVHANTLKSLLNQNDLECIDKIILIDGRKFNIRIIKYNVDFYTKAITDIVDIKNKYIFVQCWSDDEFYFETLSNGDIHTVTDFVPIEINKKLNIILIGYSSPYYPKPPFIWSWCLEKDSFYPSKLFTNRINETDEYFVFDNVDFVNNICKQKWTFQTDGAYLSVEKRLSNEVNTPSDYLNVKYEVDDENKSFVLTSITGEGLDESSIKLVVENEKLIIK